MYEAGENDLPLVPLSSAAQDVYARITNGAGACPDDRPALEELLALGLVTPSLYVPGRFEPTDVQQAERNATIRELGAIRHHLGRLSGVPDLFAALPKGLAPAPLEGIERLASLDDANRMLTTLISGTESSVWSAHPKDRPAWSLEKSLARELELVRQGKRFRTIYPSSARQREAESKWVSTMSAAGAKVRTRVPDFVRMIIVDGRTVIVSDPKDPEGTTTSAYCITHPVVVSIMVAVYEQLWARSEPWKGGRGPEPTGGAVTTPQTRALYRMLRAGKGRAEVARRLEISERTVTTLLNRLYEATGTDNLLALGEWWACSADRHMD
ncbi:hypothetical protein ACFWBN_02110 [Streptomyces sp. NPDC059989]|uniref:hypothetical protein n=1 Tax=Streptomyces sp. NPDC059989 TaxID=3347026 RepID=UPI0036C105CE